VWLDNGDWLLAAGKTLQRIGITNKGRRLMQVYQGHILKAGSCRKQFASRTLSIANRKLQVTSRCYSHAVHFRPQVAASCQ